MSGRYVAVCALIAACGGEAGEPCDLGAPDTICQIAGNGEAGYDGDQVQPALEGRMFLPQDAVVAADGTVYIVDWNNHRIRSWTANDRLLRWVAGNGPIGDTLDEPISGDLKHPTSAVLAAEGTLLVAAWHNSQVRAVDLATGVVTDLFGDGRRDYFGDSGDARAASFDLPTALAWSPGGELAILDQNNQVIRRVDDAGRIERIAGMCVVESTAACGPQETPTQCPQPGSGKLYCGGNVEDCFKECTARYAASEDPLAIRMAQPSGQTAEPGGRLAYAPDGSLYFADSMNHVIRRIAPSGAMERVVGIEPVSEIPQNGTTPDGELATETRLDRPTDLAFASDGTLYFTDVYNHCVRKRALDGRVYTVAGVCGEKGFDGDRGRPTDAHLKLPYGIELAGTQLFIADSGNHVVRVVALP